MELLAPWWAALAAAAAVPLLLHLMRRRIGTRVDFPAVRYLERAEQEHSARLKLRNWLLMALRVLAVLLIALAAARPVARVGGAGHAPSAIAIVLDNSLSTNVVSNGRPLLAALRDDARTIAARASADDRVWLVTADGRVVGGDRTTARDAIDRVEPIAGAGDLPRAVARAADLVRSSARSGAVVVVTDGQASAWRATADAANVHVVLRALGGAAPANRAVIEADPQPARWAPLGTLAVRVRTTDSVAFRVAERAADADRTLARGTAADAELRVHVTPTSRGWIAGTVSIAPDELRGDDERWFAAFAGDPPRVAVLPSAGPFAASAVATLAQSGRVSASPDPRAALVAPADEATRRPALLVAPADPSRLGAANLALERLGVPWRFGAARVGDAPVRFDDAASDSTRAGIVASRRYQLATTSATAADPLATAGGEPWIVAGPGYVLAASPLAPDATTLPVRAAFVPWLGGVLAERLSGEPGTVSAAAPGAPIVPPSNADALVAIDGRAVATGTSTAPDRPGVYYWQRGRAVVGALVVNVEPAESDLARASARDIAGHVRGARVTVARDADEASTAALGGEGRRPIAGSMLAAALLALLGEGLATRRRRSVAARVARAA